MCRSGSACATGRWWKTSSIRFTPTPEAHVGAPRKTRDRRAAPTVCVRLAGHVTLAARPDGAIDACFDGVSLGLGTFDAGAAERALALRTGLPLGALAAGRRAIDKDIHRLVRRLAGHGLVE